MLLRKLNILVLALALIVSPTSVFAQDGSVKQIIVEGNKRVETETIKSFVDIKAGDKVDARKIDQALKNVFDTELFADVKISVKGNNLHVKIIENPIISQVVFEGNNRITDDDLSPEVRSTSRAVYNKSTLQHDVQRILNIYQQSGRFSTSVVPKVIQLPKNRVNLVFEIDEGVGSEIKKISFVGNNTFSSNKLRTVIQTKEARWYRFFSSDDNYNADRIEFDKELLRRHYISLGYADFKVISVNAELTPEKSDFFITFTIDEGDKYNFGKMDVNSKLPNIEGEQLSSLLETKSGEVFNAQLVDSSIDEITKYLGNLGYAFVKIEPKYNRDADKNLIGINYAIEEGPRVYIERIDINGNVRTLDEVIRREFRIAEGDPYNAEKIKRSQQRVQNLGFFGSADIKSLPASEADKVNIGVNVTEKSTGELSFGAGFSTTDGALGDISISERNLLGKGQFLKLNLTVASIRQEIDFSFTEPYFMGKNVAAGFDLFNIKQDGGAAQSNRTFDNETVGGTLRASYPLTEYLRHSLRYSYREDDISDVDPTASQFIRKQEGKNSTSLFGHSLVYDKRDNRFQPSEGFYLRLNQDLAGLGGDSKFFRNELRGGYYYPVSGDDIVLKLVGKAGHILGFEDKDVRINERFFIGGNDLRGFASDGLGPRDENSKDPLGGKIYFASTLEMMFPIGLPDELGFKGAIFTDLGTLYDTDESTTVNNDGSISRVLDEASPRGSVGLGISWGSPMGPIRIDYAVPYMKESFDDVEELKFTFGTRF